MSLICVFLARSLIDVSRAYTYASFDPQVEEILHHFPKAALGSGDGRSVAASSVPAAAASTSKAQKKKKSKKKTQKKST